MFYEHFLKGPEQLKLKMLIIFVLDLWTRVLSIA